MLPKDEIVQMINFLSRIIDATKKAEKSYATEISKVHSNFRKSAINLVHYKAFRSFDIRGLQKRLSQLGLSRLGKAEAHLLTSLQMTKGVLESFIAPKKINIPDSFLTFSQGDKLLPRHTQDLLGPTPQNRPVRIMVTQPREAVENMDLLSTMVHSGMDIARINCAHDGPQDWEEIINKIRKASKDADRHTGICMDLGGPKIRTGTIHSGIDVVKYKPQKDRNGKIVEPAGILLVANAQTIPKGLGNYLVLPSKWIGSLEPGDTLKLLDARGKRRKLVVSERLDYGIVAHIWKTCYFKKGMTLKLRKNDKLYETHILDFQSSSNQFLALRTGDFFLLEKDNAALEMSPNLIVSEYPRVSCTSADIFRYVELGNRVLFDDGKITGEIVDLSSTVITIKVTHTKGRGAILREDKGINFPDTQLEINGLTQIDRQNLPFIARHADMVSLSFVNRKEDVQELLAELEGLPGGKDLGIILKIETKASIQNLVDILLMGMQVYPLGIMIARGDLAVECGWENMAIIQEEILSLCMASHIPVVWATQVLENLAKKGLPSRAEITDAAMSQRAECVMLNKGEHIVKTIKMLDRILADMSQYQHKKSPILPAMKIGM